MATDQSIDWAETPAAVWRRHRQGLRAIRRLDPVGWDDLTGIGRQQEALARNTERFLAGEPSNLFGGVSGIGLQCFIFMIDAEQEISVMATDQSIDWAETPAAVWRRHRQGLRAIRRLDPVGWDDLTGIGRQQEALARNTERFLAGEPSNNTLLWGARGTGKSSLIKALLNRYQGRGLRMIEVDKDDLVDLPEIVDDIAELSWRFVIFCDDLSFEVGESGYKALKSVLEGSLELPPENVRVYATSNRRHLMPEFMDDNLKSEMRGGELHPAEAIEEQVSLADRFGLQLSFYGFPQDVYLQAIDALFPQVGNREALHREAIRFATSRGARNGRTAQQFYRQFAGGTDAFGR